MLIFFDVFEIVIVVVVYLKVNYYIGFIMGKLKFVFLVGYSILCLEFCGVVLVIEIGEFVLDYFFILMFFIRYFIDSKVVLGYIRNRIRCFYNYVSNRIVCIYVVLIFS